MNVLVVVAHPLPASLTQVVAGEIANAARTAGHTAEVADLAAEGFSAVFAAADRSAQQGEAPRPHDVVAEQARLDRADHLVLVYPVYWWSMPALLKGWIERVFVSGWAFDEGEDGAIVKKLGRLKVHLVALGGASARTYARHGYADAMKVQIEHGIFDFCGAPVISSCLIVPDQAGGATDPQHIASAIIDHIDGDVNEACDPIR